MQYNRVGRNVTAIALAGDGGTSDAGFQSVSGAAERNDPSCSSASTMKVT